MSRCGYLTEGIALIKKRWYAIPIIIVAVIILIPILQGINNELSIVKIATEYGTLELTEEVGITQKNYIIRSIQTVDETVYTVFYLSSEASVVPVSGFVPLDADQIPVGMQSGHDVLFVFDNDASTEEALFFDVIVDIDGVEWHQAVIYSGTGQQLKVFIYSPQQTTGHFFTFFYQSEIERGWPSVMIQFKGYQASHSRNVFVTTYYSLTYSYYTPETEITEETVLTNTTEEYYGLNPFVSPSIDIFHVVAFFMVLVFVKNYRKKEEKP
jgi:hypothetical protein